MKGARGVLNTDALHAVRESLRTSLSEVPKYTSSTRDGILLKLTEANNYYKRVTGMDELDKCQERVTSLQDKLYEAQETRRQTGLELAEVRKRSNELQDQLHKVKRQDNLQRFLDLMKDETELLKREQEISKKFGDQDREEREIFTAFTNSIRDSHEKQRTHLERTKYWGMILSIVGSLVTFSVSSMRTEELKRVIAKQMSVNHEPVVARLEQNGRLIESTMGSIKAENGRLLEMLGGRVAQSKDGAVIKIVDQVNAASGTPEGAPDPVVNKMGGGDHASLNDLSVTRARDEVFANVDPWNGPGNDMATNIVQDKKFTVQKDRVISSEIQGVRDQVTGGDKDVGVQNFTVVQRVVAYSILALVGVCFMKML